MELIHYGSSVYKEELFEDIKNENWVKPRGGLWSSPVDSKWGWKDWCEAEQFRECDEENSFRFKLSSAKIATIDNLKDLIYLPFQENGRYLDYETIALNYDAIYLTENGEKETRYTTGWVNLYGWDCETVLVLNKRCINIIPDFCKLK